MTDALTHLYTLLERTAILFRAIAWVEHRSRFRPVMLLSPVVRLDDGLTPTELINEIAEQLAEDHERDIFIRRGLTVEDAAMCQRRGWHQAGLRLLAEQALTVGGAVGGKQFIAAEQWLVFRRDPTSGRVEFEQLQSRTVTPTPSSVVSLTNGAFSDARRGTSDVEAVPGHAAPRGKPNA